MGKPAWKLIVGHFGVEVLQRSGELDRPKLAAIVFADSGKRRLLNMCTHPYIRRAMMWSVLMHFLRGACGTCDGCCMSVLLLGQPFVVLVSPLLFESGQLLWLLNKTVVVNWYGCVVLRYMSLLCFVMGWPRNCTRPAYVLSLQHS